MTNEDLVTRNPAPHAAAPGLHNTVSRVVKMVGDATRAEALEDAAKVAESFATCPCNGEHGRCTENDGPRAIAAAIRSLKAPTEPDSSQ